MKRYFLLLLLSISCSMSATTPDLANAKITKAILESGTAASVAWYALKPLSIVAGGCTVLALGTPLVAVSAIYAAIHAINQNQGN